MLSAIKEETSYDLEFENKGLLNIIPNSFAKHQSSVKDVIQSNKRNEEFLKRVSLQKQDTRKILIVGFEPKLSNKVIDEFSRFGKILSSDYKFSNNFIILKYEKEYEARNALKSYDPFILDKLNNNRIIKVELYYGKISKMRIKDNEEILNSSLKANNKLITVKIPSKSYKEKLLELFFFFIW